MRFPPTISTRLISSRIPWRSAAVLSLTLAVPALLGAAVPMHAPPATPVDDAGSEDGVAVSADQRYRVVGTFTPTPTNDEQPTSVTSGYRLEGGIVGVIAEDDEANEHTVSPQPTESRPRRDRSANLLDVLSRWGECASAQGIGCVGDLNADGFVGPDDLLAAIELGDD